MNLPQITFRQEFILDGVGFSVHKKFTAYEPQLDRNLKPYFNKRRSISDRIIEQLRDQKSTPKANRTTKIKIQNNFAHYDSNQTDQDHILPDIMNTGTDLGKKGRNYLKINKFQARIGKNKTSLISKQEFQSFISNIRSQIQTEMT